METNIQQLNKAKERLKAKEQLLGKPFGAYISSLNPLTETYTLVSAGPQRSVPFHHPYVGPTAWIRATPEAASFPIVSYRSDRQSPSIIDHENIDPARRIIDYQKKKSLYRPLQQGEFEFSSKGFAQSYYAARAIKEDRGGVVRTWANQDELESGQKAPLHRRVFIHNKSSKLGDEIREGVVKRVKSATETFFPKIDGTYQKELYAKVYAFPSSSLGGLVSSEPKPLLYMRSGNVIDDAGKVEKSAETGKPLRVKNIYYTPDSKEFVKEIDEEGNLIVKLPTSATQGAILKIPAGKLNFTIFSEFNISTSDSKNIMKFNSKGVQLESGEIILGKSAFEFIVKSKMLETRLNAMVSEINAFKSDYLKHIHPTPMGPSGPLLVPFQGVISDVKETEIASAKHKVGE